MKKIFIKLMFTIVLFLATLIMVKSNSTFKDWFITNIYDNTLSFTKLASSYKSLFGSSIPFKEIIPAKQVFNEKLIYSEAKKYKDGVVLTVDDDYLVPSLNKGLVIFVGEKEEYGLCVIVQQVNNVEVMYCNINHIAVKLYDYIDSGILIGEIKDNRLILVFKKDNKTANYEDYI